MDTNSSMGLYIAKSGSHWGTGVLLRDTKGRILIGKRSDDNTWCTPGGTVDPGETPVDGAYREILEETGINIDMNDMLYRGFDVATINGVTWVTWFFQVTVAEETGFRYQPSEFDSMKWAERDELESLDIFEPCRKLLQVCGVCNTLRGGK